MTCGLRDHWQSLSGQRRRWQPSNYFNFSLLNTIKKSRTCNHRAHSCTDIRLDMVIRFSRENVIAVAGSHVRFLCLSLFPRANLYLIPAVNLFYKPRCYDLIVEFRGQDKRDTRECRYGSEYGKFKDGVPQDRFTMPIVGFLCIFKCGCKLKLSWRTYAFGSIMKM